MESPIYLLIVAADPLVRYSLARLLDEIDIFEVTYVTDPANFFASLVDDDRQHLADVAVWDLGWETGELEMLDFGDIDIPVATLVANEDQMIQAWYAGARTILARDFEAQDLRAALPAAAAGMVVLDPILASALLPAPPRAPGDLAATLTSRETEVLQLLAEGLTNRAIAVHLEISTHTVKFHVNAILTKLDAQSRTEAVVIATRLGFIVL